MKRKELHQPPYLRAENLKNAMLPMRPEFEAETDLLLRALPEERKEKNVKYKFSVSIALAVLFLFLTCATALAISAWREEGEKLVKTENEKGGYEEWPLEDKLMLLSFMEKNGIEMDAGLLDTALDVTRPEDIRSIAADKIVAERYGVDGRIDAVSAYGIIETEFGGTYGTWTLEEKAWWGETERRYRNFRLDESIPVVPGRDDLTQAQAVALAKEALKTYKDYDDAAIQKLDGAEMWVDYEYAPYQPASFSGRLHWRIAWYGGADEDIYEDVILTKEGTAIQVAGTELNVEDAEWEARQSRRKAMINQYGPEYTWNLAQDHEYDPVGKPLPNANEMSPEEAAARAREIAVAEGLATAEEMEGIPAYPHLIFNAVTPEGKEVRYYHVYFEAPGQASYTDFYVTLDSVTGETMNFRRVENG